MTKKLLLLSLFSALFIGSNYPISAAETVTFKRFWRGYQKTDLTSFDFLDKINTRIVPATRELFSKPSGLLSYHPVVTNSQALVPSSLVAEEYAFLQYTDEETYRTFRATPDGVAYTDVHWELFDKDRSKSAIVEPFVGKIENTHAYDLIAKEVDWKKGDTLFSIYVRKSGISDLDYHQSLSNFFSDSRSLATGWGLRASIVLVMPDHVALYENWKSVKAQKEYSDAVDSDMPSGQISIDDSSDLKMSIHLKKGDTLLNVGEGLRVLKP